MAEIFNPRNGKGAFKLLGHKIVDSHDVKHLFQMKQVVFQASAVYKNIIKEYQDTFPQEGSENMIHQPLECIWCICQAKCHD